MNDKTIKLFPSSWLYNASVIGFLKVMAYGLGDKTIENWLNDDGTVDIDTTIFSNALNFYFDYHKKYNAKGKPPIYGNSYYKNFINTSSEKKNINGLQQMVKLLVNNLENNASKYMTCSVCGMPVGLKDAPNDIIEFLEKRSNFNTENGPLGPSFSFPNSFWNLDISLHLCPLCVYLNIHHHLAFKQIKGEQIFINAPSFKLMWYLNETTEKLFNADRLKNILGIKLIKLSQKINKSIGIWSLMNIEMIVRTINGETDNYSIPANVSSLLLNNNISSLIVKSNENFILNLILEERFDDLLELNRRLIRFLYADDKDKLIKTDDYIKNINYHNNNHLVNLINVLPELYIKIREYV